MLLIFVTANVIVKFIKNKNLTQKFACVFRINFNHLLQMVDNQQYDYQL